MSRRRTTVTLVAASVLLTVAALTACSGPTPPAPTTPTRASAPASATPAPTTPAPSPTWPPQVALPTPPPEMARDDETGAIAAATYFLELYRYTEATQDTAAWTAITHPDCIFCRSVTTDIESRKSKSQVVVPAEFLVSAKHSSTLNAWAYGIEFQLSTGPDEIRAAGSGQLLAVGPRGHGTMTVTTVYHGAQWLVREVQLDQSQ